ncbi:carbohydrate binding domain-containing protein [Rhizomicrobium electricum]|uniref:mannan endo-1,4-beta-mannosidase n=1 Tax=Rhizomicrobium electricum TaxID=480070 RepID=A0ABN1EMG6_9PROT|nr:carbohydrate binding domain-containing protein [Rhizomicrobium electricum]NIJ46948.1 hypothetical protein [Rhizomicrobium electricum]
MSIRAAVAAVVLMAGSAAAGDLFPFTMPWNDAGTGNITDISAWNDKPAGAKGFVTVANGHLTAGGKRLQLLGVNVTFGANAPTHEDADIVARRMARFGINIVRLHHMDTHNAPNGLLENDRITFNPEYLDRLDYFIAALKRQGVYVDINLHVGRTYPGFATWPGGDNYFKGVDHFYPQMVKLQKDYARDLLSHRNPYTGTRYGEEPAVAIVEINNENGLIREWGAGALDGMTEPLRGEITRQWNAWLKQRYGSDAALRKAWGARSEPLGKEMFTSGWQLQTLGGAKAKLATTAAGVAMTMESKGQEDWHVQMHQGGLNFIADQPYTLTLKLRADHPMSLAVQAMQTHEPWKWLWSDTIKVGTEWKTVSVTFSPTFGETGARLTLGGLGFETGTLEIAEASLRPGGTSGLKPGESLDRGTIAISEHASRFSRTPAAQRDWLNFLWDTEVGYWREMQRFLKEDLGVKPPIVGSQAVYSPAPIQSMLDVVDDHSYWQHPHFPGRPWDPDNWRIKNVPMAGVENGGTIAELALRRVPGKPFIVSEYNAPAPNDYQAETMPLIAAYGALQDWDGIFLFDFGGWNNNWHTDHIDSFFDSRSNPVKLASLIATAAMLRRGDVTAAAPTHATLPDRAAWIEALRQSAYPPSGANFGMPKDAALARSVGAIAGSGPAPAWPVKSDTGELTWGIGGKTVVIDAARSKGLIGAKLGQAYDAHGVGLELTEAQGDWGVLTATVVQGTDFSSPGRILVTALGREENTGQQWTDASRTSVGRNWGQAPVLVEGLGARITLPVAASRVTAFALDELGNRKAPLPVTGSARATVEIGERYRTLWYEIVVK